VVKYERRVMNLIDYEVLEVLSKPIQNPYGWNVNCIIIDEGGEKQTSLFFTNYKKALEVKTGYIGQH
jgi:hypothetical protein